MATNKTFFVVKEDGELQDTGTILPESIALEMMDRIKAGDLQGAKALLDWLREDQQLEGGDDPLGGPVFPRFWTKGEAADARKMKLAAASMLVVTKPTVAQGVALLEEARKRRSSRARKDQHPAGACDWLLDTGQLCSSAETASALLKQEPESLRAFMLNAQALMELGRYDEAIALADERLKLLDGDQDALAR